MAIVISAVITTIETIPSFRSTDNKIWYVGRMFEDDHLPQLDSHYYPQSLSFDTNAYHTHNCLARFYIETIMVILFTIELIARIIAHSDSWKQFKKFVLCKSGNTRNRKALSLWLLVQ
jgi:hypothetical protein